VSEVLGFNVGVQVDLTPIGAYQVFGLPMSELTNRIAETELVLGPPVVELEEQLACAPTWQERFSLLDSFLLRRIEESQPMSGSIAWAIRRLELTQGLASIGSLALELGWSRKHLITRFRDQAGLPPKTMGRIFRFDRAVARIERETDFSWADLALDCGYYDQAHLIRDFVAFSGVTPTEFVRSRYPGERGVAA